MISDHIQPGTIVFHSLYGEGVFKSCASGDNAIVEFEDDVEEVNKGELIEAE